MTAMDATGLLTLEELADKLHATGRTLILCGARPQPAALLHQGRFERRIGRDNVCPHIGAALQRAEWIYRSKNGTNVEAATGA
jgi:SulP family sulfate permease